MIKKIVSFILIIFCLGLSQITLNDIETAIIQKDFHKAHNIAEDYIGKVKDGKDKQLAFYYLALSKLRLGQYSKARDIFKEIIKLKPERALIDKAYLGVIDSYNLSEEYEKGLSTSKKLLDLRPETEFLSLLYLKIARANLKTAQWSDARIYLFKIIEEFPDSLEAHLAKQLLEEKQYFSVQVGSFLSQKSAEVLALELKGKGEYAYIVETIDKSGRIFYRVRVGRYSRLDQAQTSKQKLSNLGYPTKIYP